MDSKEITAHIQDCIIFLSITETEFLKIIRTQLRPDILSSSITKKIITACFRFYDQTQHAPQDHICDILSDDFVGESDERKNLVLTYLDRVTRMKPPDSAYVIRRLSDFIKTKEFQIAAVNFVKLVNQQQFEEGHRVMTSALRAGIQKEEIGCDYFTDLSSIYLFDEDKYFVTSTGFDLIDMYRGGFYRKEFVCGLGGYKGKKSWYVIHVAVQALIRGLNVLHVSHENTLEETELRYDRMVGSLRGVRNKKEEVFVHYYDEQSETIKNRVEKRPSVCDPKEREIARKKLEAFGGRLIIRKFPQYSCSMQDLEGYLDYLENYEKFHPDILINDYADIMRPIDSRKSTRDSLSESYMYHKRLADDRDMVVMTLSQAKREAIRSKRLRMQDFAEDIRKIAHVDTAYGICQSESQVESSTGTLYTLVARSGPMDFGCGIVMNLDIGQFCTETFPVNVGVQIDEEENDED